MSKFTEAQLEAAVIALLAEQGYAHHLGESLQRKPSDVLIKSDLKQYLISRYAANNVTLAEVEQIIRKIDLLPSSALYESNLQFMQWLSDGFVFKRDDYQAKDILIQLLDFENEANNCYKVVTQLKIEGTENRIPDAIIYINGLPLIVFEFKSAIRESTTIHDAYKQINIRYRRDIPALLKYNAICIISDGVNNRSGSCFAGYDFFYTWGKIDGTEKQAADGIHSLHTMIKGLFNQQRLSDVLHHFIYMPDVTNGETKILCRYPQYYGARKLFDNILKEQRPQGNGRGGTYFGATGCGKSYTMLFLTRLLMKSEQLGNPTVILITDRTDLDDQLSETFTNAKRYIGDENVISVSSRADLKTHLEGRKSGGILLTTIQKFSEDTDLLTDRNNVICISDEAHRSQVNLEEKVTITEKGVKRTFGFAYYLHQSLPNATYVGFTGTPIDDTIKVFGEVVDYYTMSDSVKDGITERIVYEGRAAKVLLDNKELEKIEKYYQNSVAEGATEYQVEASKKATTQLEVVLGDEHRLQKVAEDFLKHYEKRVEEGGSVKGKAMFVCANRKIAYSIYQNIIELRPNWTDLIANEIKNKEAQAIAKINMVMTRNKDDDATLYNLLGTKEYRKTLDNAFKDGNSNFKVAIVVDMWLTGFDVPFLDTMYIDKPIKMHNLVQTISRVNRKYKGKNRGLVVDYIGIKSSMNLALAKYSKVDEDDFIDVEKAVVIVKNQLHLLFNIFHHFNTNDYFKGTPLQQLDCLKRGAEFIQGTENLEKRFMQIVKKLKAAYDLCASNEGIFEQERERIHFYLAIRSIIYKLTKGDAPDTEQMNIRVRQMIEEAIISEGVEEIIKIDHSETNTVDIFSEEHLAKVNALKLPNTKIKILQQLLKQAIDEFKKVNKVKGVDFSKRLKTIIDKYNDRDDVAFANDVLDDLAEELINLFKAMNVERESFNDLGIDLEEKAFYDILKSVAEKHKFTYKDKRLIDLAKAIKIIVDDKAKYTDWAKRADIKAELKVDLIITLDEHGYPPVPRDDVFKEIFEQAENFRKYS
jgi:type I restriction enzyme R subunit